MPPSIEPSFRIPLPQLPPLPFAYQEGVEQPTTIESADSSETLVNTSPNSPSSSRSQTISSLSKDEVAGLEHTLSAQDIKDFTNYGDPRQTPPTSSHSNLRDIPTQNAVRTWFTRWFLEWWMMEILSWLFGAVCLVIIATVLSKYDSKPDPRWKIGISIGSFISIFSGFAKSALLLPTAEGKWAMLQFFLVVIC
jgi:Protein of unknown function (DUF3176)